MSNQWDDNALSISSCARNMNKSIIKLFNDINISHPIIPNCTFYLFVFEIFFDWHFKCNDS